MDIPPDTNATPPPAGTKESDLYDQLADFVGQTITIRVSPDASKAPIVTTDGTFTRTWEAPWPRDAAVLLVVDESTFIEIRARSLRKLERYSQPIETGGPALDSLILIRDDGVLIELERAVL